MLLFLLALFCNCALCFLFNFFLCFSQNYSLLSLFDHLNFLILGSVFIVLTFSFNLILISFHKMTFFIDFFLQYMFFWYRHFLFYCRLKWDLRRSISWRGWFRWRFLRWWTLNFLLQRRKLTLIYFIFRLLFFFIIFFLILFFVIFHFNIFFSSLVFVVFIVLIFLILFLCIFLSIFVIFTITFNISSDFNPFNFTFMNCSICIVNLNFTLECIAFYSTTRAFSSFITYVDALMYNSLLFLFFRLWSVVISWLIIKLWLLLFLHVFQNFVDFLKIKEFLLSIIEIKHGF
mgnify:CR=1 FL=1